MSKAFTREDDDGGLHLPKPAPPAARPPRTRMGYAQLIIQRDRATTTGDAARIAELEASLAAGTLEPPADSGVAALGAEITLRDARGYVRVVRLVTAGEVGLVPRGASPASPVGAAVLGARVGQDVELEGAELSVVKIAWP